MTSATVGVAHKILGLIYPLFSQCVCYNELGDLYLDKLNKHHLTRNLVHRLERLGYTVTLEQEAVWRPIHPPNKPYLHSGQSTGNGVCDNLAR